MPDRRMSLCNRLIGGLFDRLDTIASFWQTPREVEWAKAAADGLAEREAEIDVAEGDDDTPRCYFCGEPTDNIAGTDYDTGEYVCEGCVDPKTSAPTPGAVDGPAVGSPDKPTAVVGPRPPGFYTMIDRGFAAGNYDFPAYPVVDEEHTASDGGEWIYRRGSLPDNDGYWEAMSYPTAVDPYSAVKARERAQARSAEVEPPASAPSAKSPHDDQCESEFIEGPMAYSPCGCSARRSAPEFDWVTTAIPVIAGVLAEHVPSPQCNYILCLNVRRETCGEFDNWADWRAHVAPHIAVDIQSDCLTTSYDFPSGDRPRPLADFPKHQK